MLFVFADSNQSHFEGIILGRAEKSSDGRFALWGRGLDVLSDRNVTLIAGIGPANFKVMDRQSTQLHNDLLAFIVERGLLGALGLVLIGGVAVTRAFYLMRIHRKFPDRVAPVVVVFLAAIVAVLIASLTHQIFHSRELWLVLALQEAMLFNLTHGHGTTLAALS